MEAATVINQDFQIMTTDLHGFLESERLQRCQTLRTNAALKFKGVILNSNAAPGLQGAA